MKPREAELPSSEEGRREAPGGVDREIGFWTNHPLTLDAKARCAQNMEESA